MATLCALAVVAGPAPLLAKVNCDNPPDFAEGEKCFVAQFPCEYSYLGIAGAPDYTKALKCLEAKPGPDEPSGYLLALMYLNGEGTSRDLKKAETALREWEEKTPDASTSDQAVTLRKAIARCRRGGRGACPRVDYCKDLAGSTLELEICDAAYQISAEAALTRTLDRVRSTLKAGDRAGFDRAVTNFKAYQDQEVGRAYDAVGSGSIRGLAGLEQAAFVRDDFLRLIRQTIEARELKPATTGTYAAVSRQLEGELSRNLHEVLDAWREDFKDPRAKDLWKQDRSYIADYEKASRQSQLHWVKFRDSCAELASSLYRARAGQFDAAVSMKTFVTRLRIAELRYDPIGP